MMAAISMSGALWSILRHMSSVFCGCVTSLASRVTREGALKRSMLEKEKAWILSKRAFLRLAAKP